MTTLRHYIGGTHAAGSGATRTVTNPATEEVVAEYREATAADVDLAVRVASVASADPAWADLTPADRSGLLGKLAVAVLEHGGELAETESWETGKPLQKEFIDAELPLIVDALNYFAAAARDPSGLRSGEFVAGRTSLYRREPLGVVGLIAPWNYPLMTAVWKLGAALAAGCSVVLKPAPQTPGTALLLARYATEVGFPDGVFNVVLGDAETGRAMAAHPEIRALSVTGSPATGRDVLATSAPTLKRTALELGGKAPVLVFADADLTAAADTIALCMTVNTGQDCIAATRAYVQREVYQDFLDLLLDALDGFVLGDPLDPATDIGPLISAAHRQRVEGYVDEAVRLGATVLTGGGRPAKPDVGYYYAPTVLTDVPDGARLTTEEVFGPVIHVEPIDSVEQALAKANAVEYGLSAGVWTNDLDRAHLLARKLAAGTVWINDHLTLASEFPHSGVKSSGFGLDLSPDAIREFQSAKHIVIKHRES
ncbi:MAG TPA: aldehyde dehydrogenase family protein [Pseudonocardiaceae bacterium]